MKTTLVIPDSTYRVLKAKAASEGRTVRELVLRGVDAVLSEDGTPNPRRLQLPLIESDAPGSVALDNERIYDLIDFP